MFKPLEREIGVLNIYEWDIIEMKTRYPKERDEEDVAVYVAEDSAGGSQYGASCGTAR